MMKRMAWVALAATAGTATALAVILLLVNRAEWWRGLLAATLVSVLVAGVSAPLLAWGLGRELMKTVAVFFAAAGARMVLAIGGGLLAVMVGGYPPVPTMLLIVVFYLVLLAAETTVVARAIWAARA